MRTLKSYSVPELKRGISAPYALTTVTKSRVHISLGNRIMIFPCYRDVHGRETVVADPIRFFCNPDGTVYDLVEAKRDFAPLLAQLYKMSKEVEETV